jgi:serine/threonine protein kinase/tetratricopeptide (TPR) repeat protein
MSERSSDARSIFLAAIEGYAPEQWPVFLDEACGDDAALRARVEKLLRAQAELGSFDESPPRADATIDEPVTEGPGTVIGPYKLLEPIGEGGFGVVFLAEQTQPVRRKVALKVLKPGMDSRQVIARFEAERQALALMDHPHIARVFDGGATLSGRPFFVMELVKGVPITQFCDQHRLTPRQRLELFLPVCQAVQHAHQKGIIHRDLKPSNVLVSRHDTTPMVKVIDFGVAKALGQTLTNRTLFTGIAQMIGTPLYMSPEQAGMSDLDVDTRSDIYALGVLLYELLTGTTPFAKERFSQVGYDEMRRIIREEEPPRPSTRLSDSGEALASISANRHTEPAKLTKLVRGELDWIVMKALEKDRNRRYETANGFAMDVQRYLHDEPVQACPPSVGYRLRKFARRNKGAFAIAGLILFLVLTLGSGAGWVVRDRAARRTALEQEVSQALADVENASQRQRLTDALAALKRAEGLLTGGIVRDELQDRVRRWRAGLDLVGRLREAWMLRLQVDIAESRSRHELARSGYEGAFREFGMDLASVTREQAAQRIRRLPPAIQQAVIAALDDWTASRMGSPDNDPVKQAWLKALLREVDSDPWRLEMRAAAEKWDLAKLSALAASPDMINQPPSTLQQLAAHLCASAGTREQGLQVLRRAQQEHPGDYDLNAALAYHLRETPQERSDAVRFASNQVALVPDNAGVLLNLGQALRRAGRLDEAVVTLRRALALKPDYAMVHLALAATIQEQGSHEEAIAECRKGLAKERKAMPRPIEVAFHNTLGNSLRRIGDLEGAIAEYHKAINLNPDYGLGYLNLGRALSEQNKRDEGIAALQKAVQLKPDWADAWAELGRVLQEQGLLDEAVVALGKAIAIQADYFEAHFNLGNTLSLLKKDEQAAAHYRKASELKPDHFLPHYNLGIALDAQGKMDEALAAYRRTIELKPDHAEAHCNLGNRFLDQDKLEEATAAFGEAIKVKPDLYQAHVGLGTALRLKGDLAGAISASRKAIALKPNLAEAHLNLGIALQENGEFAEALIALKRTHELGSRYPGWRHPSGAWVRRCEELIALDTRVSRVLAGKEMASSAREQIAFAEMCIRKRHFDHAARFFEQAFAQEPGLGEQPNHHHHYNAACAAALAAIGDSKDTRPLTDEQRGLWRRQALAWLRADLKKHDDALASAEAAVRVAVAKTLQHWLSDPDLRGLREDAYVSKLRQEDRHACAILWSDARELLGRAQAK